MLGTNSVGSNTKGNRATGGGLERKHGQRSISDASRLTPMRSSSRASAILAGLATAGFEG